MFRSRLFLKTFSTIVVGVLFFTAAGYLSSAPWIRDTIALQDARNGQVVLNNIYELASNAHHDIEAWRESALEGYRRELRHLTQVAEKAITRLESGIAAQNLDPEAARQQLLEDIRHLTYGQDDYVFIADYESRLISHPDPELHGADFSEKQDIYGNLIVPPLVEKARKHGEGFHSYWWRRLGEEEPSQKLTYSKHLPDQKWVIGTGVYVDAVEVSVAARKAAVTERLRRHLHQTRIANTGYLYVFDSDLNMLIHPNPNIEGTDFSALLNPVTGRSIGKELIAAAKSSDRKLLYKWDKPSDPGNYIYDKISWIRYLPGFDWYIVSSVYLDEFRAPADTLTARMFIIALIAIIVSIISTYIFLRRLIVPITRLANTASRVGEGDLSAKTDILRDDEIGVLANTFNAMVDRLKDQINNMERRVAERTADLDHTVQALEARNRESAEIHRMGELLQSCREEKEIYTVAAQTAKRLFPKNSGLIYMLDDNGGLQPNVHWGDAAPGESFDDAHSCWAVRRGKTHRDLVACSKSLCPRCSKAGAESLCVPLLAEGAVIGVIKLNVAIGEASTAAGRLESYEPLMATIAEQIALSVTNLRLRERLRQQTIRDPLTGLFNRRRLEETLATEIARAERHNGRVGVVMLDVDHFKHFNDTYGHAIGDDVLREVGSVLGRSVRREDTACRYGGEEFTIVVPNADSEGLYALAEKIRASIESDVTPVQNGKVVGKVTISAGTALYPDHSKDVHGLLKAADDALYQAKEAGRNRVVEAQGGGT